MKDNTNSFCLSTIIISLCCAPFYGIFSSYIVNTSKNASLISLVIGFFISIIISMIIYKFIVREKDMNFTQKIKNYYPKMSLIINIISILAAVSAYILITYRLTTFLSNEYLTSTPKYIILLLILSLTFYTSSKWISTVIRVSTITFFISISIFLFDAGSLISQISFDNFLPLLDVKYTNIIKSSVVFAMYFSVPLIYLNILSYNQIIDSYKFKIYYYSMIILSFIVIFVSLFTSIGVNGINVTKMFDYPVYSTLKRIKLFSILDSLENISISAWFLFIINMANIMLLYIFNSINELFNFNDKTNLIIRLSIMLFVFIISNIIFVNNLNESFKYIYIPIIPLGISLLIILSILFKKKRTNN